MGGKEERALGKMAGDLEGKERARRDGAGRRARGGRASARGCGRARARAAGGSGAQDPLDSTRVSPTGFASFLSASVLASTSFLAVEIVSSICVLFPH